MSRKKKQEPQHAKLRMIKDATATGAMIRCNRTGDLFWRDPCRICGRRPDDPIHDSARILAHIQKKYPAGKAIRIVGDSMEPTMIHDDLWLVDTAQAQVPPQDGQIAAVYCKALGGSMVGRYHETPSGLAWLQKDNPECPPVLLGSDDRFTVLGPVVVLISRLERRVRE